MPAISADSLYKVFGKRSEKAVRMLADGSSVDDVRKLGATPAVIDVSFDVEPGEIFVVMGLSGSGKSTLIRMLNGLLEPTSGTVQVDGARLTGLKTNEMRQLRRNKISMVFQHFALFPHRTVLENAAYGLQVKGIDEKTRREKGVRALEMVGLEGWGDFLPDQLSGGMRQRVGLARALAAETDVVLMDEAFSALDPLIRREMQDQLLELQARLGKTIVFITHDLNEAMRLGDRIAVMRDGRIVQIGTAEDILTDPANDYVAQFVQDVDRTRVLTASSVMEPPRALTDGGGGPRAALRIMREQQTTAAFVVNRDKTLVGAVRDEVVDEAVRSSDQRKLSELADPDVVKVSPDTPLVELFAPSAEHRLPLAVVDEGDRLLGVVPRVTLLHALGAIGAETNGHTGTEDGSAAPAPEEPSDAEASTQEGEARADV